MTWAVRARSRFPSRPMPRCMFQVARRSLRLPVRVHIPIQQPALEEDQHQYGTNHGNDGHGHAQPSGLTNSMLQPPFEKHDRQNAGPHANGRADQKGTGRDVRRAGDHVDDRVRGNRDDANQRNGQPATAGELATQTIDFLSGQLAYDVTTEPAAQQVAGKTPIRLPPNAWAKPTKGP